ncbi:MAG TPA: ABC transporter ATP-binding protein [Acidimicrobiales bacterium]|nr:ABC transporter ATP-binding protein [Acidimicrobiales bacterium]
MTATMAEPAIVVEGVSKRFRLYHERNRSLKATIMRGGRVRYEEFWALRDVSLEIPEGITFGLVGENGSGKSTLLKCIAKILRPDDGRIRTRGKMAALLELGSGFHPELSGRENVFLNGSILGLSKRELTARFDEIVGFAGLERFIDQPVKNYSSGMYVRLGFSVAINIDPDVLLVDEVLAVGDAVFQRRCNEKFADFRRAGKTVVIVSHAADAMRTMCDEVAWLKGGQVVTQGRAEYVVDHYVDEGHEDRVEVAVEEAESRWGSGEVRLQSVQLVDESGRQITHPSTGDAVTFRLRYRAVKAVSKPVFGLALETLDGTWLWAHHTRDAGFVPDEIYGEGTVDLHVPHLMLQPGTYDLSASVVDYTTTHQYDYLRRCLRFDVEHGTPRESGGYVALGGKWSSADFDA